MVFTIIIFLFFFFSSRRRHTRFDCDWSSDVCSSDLASSPNARARPPSPSVPAAPGGRGRDWSTGCGRRRSEERRVGKECSSRWSTDNKKKKLIRSFFETKDYLRLINLYLNLLFSALI